MSYTYIHQPIVSTLGAYDANEVQIDDIEKSPKPVLFQQVKKRLASNVGTRLGLSPIIPRHGTRCPLYDILLAGDPRSP